MNLKLGEKIRTLRKSKNISQEVLANYLGVSFQAVSKWEKGETLPDVTAYLKGIVQENDVVITMGAGDIFRAGEALLNE